MGTLELAFVKWPENFLCIEKMLFVDLRPHWIYVNSVFLLNQFPMNKSAYCFPYFDKVLVK